MSRLEELINNNAFYYIAPNGDLCLCDDGHILTPGLGGTRIAKAYWVKNSPQTVWLFKDVYDSRDKFLGFLRTMIHRGANKHSVINVATQAGGKALANEVDL